MANFTNADKDGQALNKYGKLAVGVGLATVAAVGAAWANSKSRQAQLNEGRSGPPSMIDWERVRTTAHRMNANENQTAEWRQHWNKYYSELVARAVPIIEEYAHTTFPRNLDTVNAVSRTEWADANIVSFKQLFEPIEKLNRDAQKNSSPLAQMVTSTINQTVLSAEVGILLGYLGRRVLGQYDLSLLGKEPIVAGKVFFVEPNINQTVLNMGIDGDEFRLWIALHETTHAFEFESHPWLRQHFNSILETYFSLITDDLKRRGPNGGLGGYIKRIRENASKGGGWIERVMTPEQHVLFEELQALMSIVEGYSNHMMNAIGAKLMPNYELIKNRMDNRAKNRTLIDKLFVRLTGMNLKMEQYRLGEIFVDSVVEKKGIDFANLIWAEAKYLPTLQEVKEPSRWISRVEAMQAA